MNLNLLNSTNGDKLGSVLVVVSCSALKKKYRDILVENIQCNKLVHFVFLDILQKDLHQRLQKRALVEKHFMPSSLIESQLQDLDKPFSNEGRRGRTVTVIDGNLAKKGIDEIGTSVLQKLVDNQFSVD